MFQGKATDICNVREKDSISFISTTIKKQRMAKKINQICATCNSNFEVRYSEVKRGNGKYCSRACVPKNKPKKEKVPNCICGYCKKQIFIKISKLGNTKSGLNFCSRICKESALKEGIISNYWSEEQLKALTERNTTEESLKYKDNPNTCKKCNKILTYKKRRFIYCSKNCQREEQTKNRENLKTYRSSCTFKFCLNDYPDEFDFSLIEEYGWYSPTNKNNNLDGISRDHMFSIRNGYELSIDPNIIAHPANCRLMKHTDNFKKKSKSSISLKELIERIRYWDKKYKQ